MPKTKYLRVRKLVRPRLQLRLTSAFVGLVCLALAFQFVLFTSVMSETLDKAGGAFSDQFVEISGAYQRIFVISLLVVLPLTALVGVMTTFRIVGPLFNISRFLQNTLDGKNPPNCRLRSGDEYQDLADLVNRVTEPLRRGAGERGTTPSADVEAPGAALPAEDRTRVS